MCSTKMQNGTTEEKIGWGNHFNVVNDPPVPCIPCFITLLSLAHSENLFDSSRNEKDRVFEHFVIQTYCMQVHCNLLSNAHIYGKVFPRMEH